MNHRTQLDDKLGKADNFRAWKYRTSLILEENDLDQYISKEVLDPEEIRLILEPRESFHILLRIISSLMCHP